MNMIVPRLKNLSLIIISPERTVYYGRNYGCEERKFKERQTGSDFFSKN